MAGLLRDKGCYIYSADEAARVLTGPGRPAWKRIVARFGPGILNTDRAVDRARLGSIVFGDPEARAYLNALIHPLVAADRRRTADRIERQGDTRIFVSEAALTLEASQASFFDRVVVVHCAARVQVARLMDRDAVGPSEARRKIGAQMPQAEKIKRADYTIDTSGSMAETVEQVERLYAELSQDHEILCAGGLARPRGRAGNKRAA